MRLSTLNPEWLRGGGEGISWRPPGTDGGADVPVPPYTAGISFDCPCGCGKRRYLDFKNPPEPNIPGAPYKSGWERKGDTFENLTLSPSIFAKRDADRPDNCGWHGYITGGDVEGKIDLPG